MIELDFPALEVTPALVRLNIIAGRFSNFIPVMGGRVDVLARRLIRRQFETQGRASGQGQWAPLTKDYRDVRKFPEKPLLRQEDALYKALTKKGDPNQELTLTPFHYALTVREGAQDSEGRSVHARFVGHQLGVPVSNVPVREMIPDPLPKTFISELRAAIKAYVLTGRSR